MTDAPKIQHHGNSGADTSNAPLPSWLDPHYGYKKVVNKKTGKVTWTYVGSTQYLNQSLGDTGLSGVLDLLGHSDNSQVQQEIDQMRAAASIQGGKPLTANQAMFLFKNADPAIRAQVQAMMYRAGGLYSKTYTPVPGAPLTKQDIDAFRKFIIGAASNPSQGPIGDLLNTAATAGDAMGTASSSVYKPLVSEVTDPKDITEAANQVGLKLHGTYLSNDQMNVFVAAYQTMEKAFQQQEYTAQGGNLDTGMVNPANATFAAVTKPPSVEAAVSDQIRHEPNFKSNTFTDRLDEILAAMNTGSYGNAGPPL